MIDKRNYNRTTIKQAWTNDDLRELMELSKTLTVSEIAKKTGRSEVSVKNRASIMGYGYRNK